MEEQDGWNEYQRFVISELERNSKGLDGCRNALTGMVLQFQNYNAELQNHIRGVKALERRNDILEEALKTYKEEVRIRLEAVEAPFKMAQMIREIAKWVFIIGSASGLIYAGMRWFGWVG